MILRLFFFLFLALVAAANARPQDDIAGYNYEVPENPLTINRPEEPIEAASDLAAEAQESHDEGSHGGGGHGHHGGSSDPLDWLRESIPGKFSYQISYKSGVFKHWIVILGEPETDYPILSEAPETSFSCDGQDDGMYADVEARCQVWHQCFAGRSWSFLCPNGTIFNQEIFTCVWWFDFDCSTAESFYNLNAGLYSGPSGEDAGADTGAGGSQGDGAVDVRNETPIAPARRPEQPARRPDPPAAPTPSEPLEPLAPVAPVIPLAPEEPLGPIGGQFPLGPEPIAPDTAASEPIAPANQPIPPVIKPAPADIPQPLPPTALPDYPDYEYPDLSLPINNGVRTDDSFAEYDQYEEDQAAPDEPEEVEEEGYSYPVPDNPLELPERPQEEAADDSLAEDNAVAPLALYGAPPQPFELPPDSLPTQAPVEAEEDLLAQYLPPQGQRQARRQGRLGRRGRGGRRRGQRRKRLIKVPLQY